jgi:hypothetical protein
MCRVMRVFLMLVIFGNCHDPLHKKSTPRTLTIPLKGICSELTALASAHWFLFKLH